MRSIWWRCCLMAVVAVVVSACVPQNTQDSEIPENPPKNTTVYTVQAGDTLYGVSARFGVTQNDIIRTNRLRTHFLYAGQKLYIPIRGAVKSPPKPQVYIVKKGDYLSKIAQQYGTTVRKIQQQNGLSGDIIYPNQRLVIGADTAQPSAQQAPVKPPKIVSTGQFIPPVQGKQIRTFGTFDKGGRLDGINIAAKLGDTVKSADSGRVVYTGNAISGYGNMVLVSHAEGYVTVYAHLDTIRVGQGNMVKQGQSLGTVGQTGDVTTPQLHFQVRLNQKPLDPNKYLR